MYAAEFAPLEFAKHELEQWWEYARRGEVYATEQCHCSHCFDDTTDEDDFDALDYDELDEDEFA